MTDLVMKFRPGGAIKAVTGRKLDVLACPFGGPDDLDSQNEYFSRRTDFMIEVGDRRPVLYFHGFTPNKQMMARPNPIGVATVSRIDDEGVHMEVELDDTPISDRQYAAAEAGTCRASTGSVVHLCRPLNLAPPRHSEPLAVEVWPIGELSLLDEGLGRHPANEKAIAIPLRASFKACDLEIPEAFGEDATDDQDALVSNPTVKVQMESTMSEIDVAVKAALEAEKKAEAERVAEKAALKAEVLKELEGEPKHKALFNIRRETAEEPKDPAKAETYEYLWALRHPRQLPAAMKADPYTETDAAEGLPLVPADMLNSIVEKRDEASFIRRAGCPVLQTDKLILNIPVEATKMVTLAPIAEEAVYTENVQTLATVPATVVKHGGFVDCSEEFLEDQNLFQPFLVRAIGRAWGLAENVDAADLLVTGTGVKLATQAVITEAEMLAWYFALDVEYRDNGAFFMGDDMLSYLRSKTSANAFVWGDMGFSTPLGVGPERLLGKPVFTNANLTALGWLAGTPADNVEVANFCDVASAYRWVERRGLKIMVDPYFQALNGIVRYYFSARWTGVKVNADATALISAEKT